MFACGGGMITNQVQHKIKSSTTVKQTRQMAQKGKGTICLLGNKHID